MRDRLLVATGLLLIGCDPPPPAPPPAEIEKPEVRVQAPKNVEGPESLALPPPPVASPVHHDEVGKFGKKELPAKGEAKAEVSGLLGALGSGRNEAMGGLRGGEVGAAKGLGGLGTRGVGVGSLGVRGSGSGGGGTSVGYGAVGHSVTISSGVGYAQGSGGYGSVSLPASGDFAGREELPANKVTRAAEDRLSTFAIDVDTAAYSIARRTLNAGLMPTASLVRVEELINYFHYDYDAPSSEPFAIQLDGARSPVDGTKRLLRVGIQARQVAERRPSNLVFLIDTSGSMQSPDKLELAKKALAIAVDHLGPTDKVAISTYAGGVRLVLPPTPANERAKIKAALDGLSAGGGTAMESGLVLAYKQAAQMLGDGMNTRIVVCSDGDANLGAMSPDAMLKTIEGYVKEGVRISTIGFGDGNYKDAMMETIADKGNGNYYYVDTLRMAERVFGRDLTQMIEDVAEDVKIQVDFDPAAVETYRLVGYENRDVADKDFRNDRVDAGEIGSGHQVTALYELSLLPGASGALATVRVRAKTPRGVKSSETEQAIAVAAVERPFEAAPKDLRFAVAVMGAAELFRGSPYADGWTFDRVLSLVDDSIEGADPDRREFRSLIGKAASLGRTQVSAR